MHTQALVMGLPLTQCFLYTGCHNKIVNEIIFLYSTDAIAYSYAYFGEGAGTIELDDVNCYGTESTLLDCTHSTIGNSDCGHYEDASVECQSSCKLTIVNIFDLIFI